MTEGAQTVELGSVLGARYRVERVLGKSTMALVVVAHDLQRGEPVAIKILLPQRVANAEVRARFGREARAAGKLKGEHVARVTDVGALDDGAPYMVMEYLDGESLAAALTRRSNLPPPEAILYVLQVCEVLREAHALGIVHRGLTPANLFLAKRPGRPPGLKVLDFGISRVEDRDAGRTLEGSRSPWYMAPEQMKSAMTVDARSDIWAVGVILFELVVGEVPFDAETIPEVVLKVLNEMPNLRGAPKPMSPIFRRCLAKAPAQRYRNVDELVVALRSLDGVALEVEARPSTVPPAHDEIVFIRDEENAQKLDDDVGELVDELTEVADDDDDDEDGEVVDEAELIPSLPPFAAPLQELPKAPPRLLVWPDRIENVTPAPAVFAVSAVASPAPAPSGETTVPTRRPPPPEPPRTRQRTRGEARGRWLALVVIAVLIPAGVFVAGRLLKKEESVVKPEPSQPAPLAATVPVVPASVEAPTAAAPTVAPTVAPGMESVAASVSAPPVAKATARPPQPRPDVPVVPVVPVAKVEDNATVATQVAMRNHVRLRQACWESSDRTAPIVSVSTAVDPSGAVTSANASSADPKLAECVAAQVRSWSFPPSSAPRTLQIPIRFRR